MQKLVIPDSQFGYSNTDPTWVSGPILSTTFETHQCWAMKEQRLEIDTQWTKYSINLHEEAKLLDIMYMT